MSFWIFRRSGAKQFTYAWAPDPNDKQKRRQVTLPDHLKTKAEATKYARDHRAELETERPTATRVRPATVADLAERWETLIKADKRRAWSTIKDNISHLHKWILPKFGSKLPSDLDAPKLRAWVREVREKVAAYTCRNILATLAAFLDDIAGEGWAPLTGNVARLKAVRTELPEARPVAGRSQKLRIADLEHAQRLVDCEAIPMERRVRYAVDLTSGLRDGELAGLRWEDINLDAPIPFGRVDRALQLKSRRGGAALGGPKTEDSKRAFPLHPAAVAALRFWWAEGWERYVTRAPRPRDAVFPQSTGEPHRPRSAENARRDLAASGLPSEVEGHALTFHAFRRSFASWLGAGGVPDEAISRLLGHAPRTTANQHYTEADLTILAGFVSRIGIVWRTPGRPCVEPM